MITTRIKALFEVPQKESIVSVAGWVKTKRVNKEIIFITLNDGSTLHNLQIVGLPSLFSGSELQQITTGTSLSVQGKIVPSIGSLQSIELHASEIKILGSAQGYPLQPKKHSHSFLRDRMHLRFRTTTFGAIFRIRHAISYAIHQFFFQRDFVYVHTPIITSVDAEGAGEMFRVTGLDLHHIPQATDGIDFKQDFFGKPTYLTVSGQLAAEAAALGLGAVYTFGPTFRAENSNTSRHLSEFWMVEPEVAFNDLQANALLAEDFLKYLLNFVLDHCKEDLRWLHQRTTTTDACREEQTPISLLDRLQFVLSEPFVSITYEEAMAILKAAPPNQDGTFVFPIQKWGVDLQSEHERYLVEHHFKKPVVVVNYPKEIKSFYMRQNEDGTTVAAMDILFPGVGELMGGSQREERLDKLSEAIVHKNMDVKELNWYLDTRRFGTVPHSGFGLGLERLVQFVTGMDNIRDVIPFPRTPGRAAC